MLKKLFLVLSLIFAALVSRAQTTDTVLLNKLADFDLSALNGDDSGAVMIGESILPDTGK
ncbi:MAG: hypothetical protein JSU01_06810, partial [Bacteroidetes bacterium]|nr:hypothetical protein [Bacteroidota bacterium]